MSEPAFIPAEIKDAYYPGDIASQSVIPGGETNLTFLVTDDKGEKTILQRLSPIYDPIVGEDYEAVAAHLKSQGWEMAEAVKTKNGVAYTSDDSGRLWRAFTYIESTPGSSLEGNLAASAALGGLLGALHSSLASLDYRPKFDHGGPRGSHHLAKRLETLLAQIREPDDRGLAEKMLNLTGRDAIKSRPSQIIHADPRIGNALFRNGKPFTFIDWDGYKMANPLVDVGDLLQSTVGEVLTKGAGNCLAAQLYPIVEAYYEEAGAELDKPAFINQAFIAARVIALDLGIRHLIDSVEDRYFVWDSRQFASRFEFNIHCARRQLSVHEVLKGA